jgi:hypothetical protein
MYVCMYVYIIAVMRSQKKEKNRNLKQGSMAFGIRDSCIKLKRLHCYRLPLSSCSKRTEYTKTLTPFAMRAFSFKFVSL